MADIDSIAGRILTSVKEYEFSTFLIGAVLPTQIYEREDAIRARLKIRGLESVKSQLTRELGLRVAARMAGKRVDYLRPDLTISVVVEKDNSFQVSARARSLIFTGRYMKRKRAVPQKQARCTACEGKGCDSCNNSGLSGYESVEGIVAKRLIDATGGTTPRFSWTGSEDRESLVLGEGRPFTVQVFDPKARMFARSLRARGAGVSALLTALTSPQAELTEAPRFSVKTRILVKCEKEPSCAELRKLEESLSGLQVSFESRSKSAIKRIYHARVRKNKDGSFYLYAELDGGLGIKQFVGGSEGHYSSSVSKLMGQKCECVTFDILGVTFLSSDRISGRD